MIDVSEGNKWICMNGLAKEADFGCAIVVIYAWHSHSERAGLWQELINVKNNIDCPMMVIGDFNEILTLEERKGGDGNLRSM